LGPHLRTDRECQKTSVVWCELDGMVGISFQVFLHFGRRIQSQGVRVRYECV
jgi:hypothetical protein